MRIANLLLYRSLVCSEEVDYTNNVKMKMILRKMAKFRPIQKLARTLEVLTGKSTAAGGLCHLYLLGTIHETRESRKETYRLVNHIKPEILLLELDENRRDCLKSVFFLKAKRIFIKRKY